LVSVAGDQAAIRYQTARGHVTRLIRGENATRGDLLKLSNSPIGTAALRSVRMTRRQDHVERPLQQRPCESCRADDPVDELQRMFRWLCAMLCTTLSAAAPRLCSPVRVANGVASSAATDDMLMIEPLRTWADAGISQSWRAQEQRPRRREDHVVQVEAARSSTYRPVAAVCCPICYRVRASKASVRQLTKSPWDSICAQRRLNICCNSPTRIARTAALDKPSLSGSQLSPPRSFSRSASGFPWGVAQLQEIAAAVAFLALSESRPT